MVVLYACLVGFFPSVLYCPPNDRKEVMHTCLDILTALHLARHRSSHVTSGLHRLEAEG